MSNEWDVDVVPICARDNGLQTDKTESTHTTPSGDRFPRLEDERLGHVLVKAWTEGYNSAAGVIRDVELAASKIGIKVVGDEVDIGENWEDVLEVRDGKLMCRTAGEKNEKTGI